MTIKKKEPTIDLIYSVRIKTDDKEGLFWHIYDAKEFKKWYCIPSMLFLTSKDVLSDGCEMKCIFPVPPFYWFTITWTDSDKKAVSNGVFKGILNGTMTWTIKEVGNGEYEIGYVGKVRVLNWFWYYLYKATLLVAHDLQTPYVMNKLKKKFESGKYDSSRLELSPEE